MIEPKDKRTKKYREWKALQIEVIEPEQIKETVGLGDVVESVTKALGIKKTKGCGCNERKALLNQIPIFRKVKAKRCFTEDHIKDYAIFIYDRTKDKWTLEERKFLIDMYSHVFALQYNVKNFGGNCQGCAKTLQSMQEKLDEVYNESK